MATLTLKSIRKAVFRASLKDAIRVVNSECKTSYTHNAWAMWERRNKLPEKVLPTVRRWIVRAVGDDIDDVGIKFKHGWQFCLYKKCRRCSRFFPLRHRGHVRCPRCRKVKR